jgi:hypothetical protein
MSRTIDNRTTPAADSPDSAREAWDTFIDALDRAGQAGSATAVPVPRRFAPDGAEGKTFGELQRDDLKALTRVAAALGRRADTVMIIWEDMRRIARRPPKTPRKDQPRRK